MTQEEGIKIHAACTPNKIAIVCGMDQITYAQLWNAIERRAQEFLSQGVRPHRPYVFRATQDINFIVNYCSLHTIKAIAVPLGYDAPEEYVQSISAEVDSCLFDENIVDILYTTGTTGKAKGVMLSEQALVSCADNFITDLGFSKDLAFIVSGPLNHIASLFKMHPVLTVGGTVCVLDGLKDMNAFFNVFNLPFKKFGCFLVPSCIRMLLQFSYEQLSSLKNKMDLIETGTAPITQHDMKLLSEALPYTRLYNTLGGTEIGAVCTYNFNDGIYKEGCIGKPMKNSHVEVTENGEIIVSGKTIMSGYVNDPETTAQVLKDGKIYGADLGYIDEDGMIHLKGRRGDVINVGGFKVDPTEVENAVASYKGIKDCICIASTHPVIGTVLKLLVVLDEGTEMNKHTIALHIKSKLESHKVPTFYEAVAEIKRLYNGKVDRKYYREHYK